MSFNFFHTALRLKHIPLKEAANRLLQIQQMGIDEFTGWQQKQAWEMVKFHYRNNDLYRNKVGKTLPDKWEDLPVMTKQDLQKPLETIITKNIRLNDCYISSTSGSSGTPFFFAKDKFSHAMTWAVVLDRYRMYGMDDSPLHARFYGIPREFVGYWKERIKDRVMNRRRFVVFDLSDQMMKKFVAQFQKNKFRYLYGYSTALVLFARYLIKNNLVLKQVCPSLELCISTSEVCTPEDHALLERGFGVKNIREYGVSETCLTGFDTPDGKWQLTEETLFNEVSDVNGQSMAHGIEGNILSTSLFNKAFPIIRYQVGDMAIFNDRENSIYRSIHSLLGRTNDTVQLPGGKIAAGFTFYYVSRSILESTGVLKEFIIRQTAIDHFIFDIVADRDLTGDEVQQINEKLARYLQPGLRLTINRVATINRPASGKLKHFYSELDHH